MKTIYELRQEGLISTRTYNSVIRGATFDGRFTVKSKLGYIDFPDINKLTVKDIFELWSEEEISKWRGLGQTAISELKGLI